MAAFVNDQIDEIQEEKSGAVGEGVKEEERVKAEPGNSRAAGDGLPFSEFVFEEGHWGKRSKVDSREGVLRSALLRVNDEGQKSGPPSRPGRDLRPRQESGWTAGRPYLSMAASAS